MIHRRPLSPGDKGWTPTPRRSLADKLLDAIRAGVADGVERHLDGHADCALHDYGEGTDR
jgi:hypothetical protein